MGSAQQPMSAPLQQTHIRALINRESALFDAARSESVPTPAAHRRIADVKEVFFREGSFESGNGVRVTRLHDGSSYVRLPITYQPSEGELVNVTLRVKPGGSVRAAYEKFLEGVEALPPDAYRIVGNEDGHEVVSELSTERYARMRAALRASEALLEEPLPEPKGTANRELLDELASLRSA